MRSCVCIKALTLGSVFLSAISLTSVGCTRAHGADRQALPAPPFEVVGQDKIKIRPDLFSTLTFKTIQATDVQATIQGFGQVAFAPNGSYAVRVPFSGFVEKVLVNVGAQVKAGETLATLRSSDLAKLRADLSRLAVTVHTEEDGITRLERLISEGAASSRELVEARGRLNTAQAEIDGIKTSLAAARAAPSGGDRLEIRASASGSVLARNLAPGERVQPDGEKPAFVIGNPSDNVVRAAFPERDAPFLSEKAKCSFTIPALGATKFDGEVTQIVRAIDPRTHTVEAVCSPNEKDSRLTAQMTARVEVAVKGNNLLVVPRSAVLIRRDNRVAFVKAGPETLERRLVDIGGTVGDSIQILKGISPGEDVVTQNAVLFDGELDSVL